MKPDKITDRNTVHRKIIILSVVLAATLTVIWGHSFMPPEESAKESGYFYELLKPFVEFFIGEGNFTELFVRKAAHFTEFFILGCELVLMLRFIFWDMKKTGNNVIPCNEEKNPDDAASGKKTGRFQIMMEAWVLGTFCALVDETVQIFSGRGSAIPDVWLDSAGCITGVLIIGLLFVLRKKYDR